MHRALVRLRRARIEKGLSQTNVADEMGINQSSYARMENKNSSIDLFRLEEAARIIGIDIVSLFVTDEHVDPRKAHEEVVRYKTRTDKEIEVLNERIDHLQDQLKKREELLNERQIIVQMKDKEIARLEKEVEKLEAKLRELGKQ